MPAYPTAWKLEVQLSAGVWTDLQASGDVIGPVSLGYGISGNGPADCVASTGELRFTLKNGLNSSGGVRGYYSPASSAVRSGWTYGIPVRLTISFGGSDYVKFRGRVRVIQPYGGIKREQSCDVIAYDIMRDLLETDVRELAVAIDDADDVLIEAVLDALPADAQPVARDIDAGLDVYPYAFDNVQGGVKAGGLIKDIASSALALAAAKGDGTFIYRNRQSRALQTSSVTLADTMTAIDVPSSLDRVYNRVRVTIRPKTIDAVAATVLYALTGSAVEVAAGQSIEIWGEYRDPSNTLKLIGGTETVAPVATTDYMANSAANGSGSNLTSSLAVTASAFASSVKFVVTNGAAVTAYLVDGSGNAKLQIRGKGIYDNGPQTYESYTAMDYGDRSFALNMPYQDDAQLAQNAAHYLNLQYNALDQQIAALDFVATRSSAMLTQALAREIGDVITVSETMTGLAAVKAVIYRVGLELLGQNIWCRWGLAPGAPFEAWLLGEAGASELGVTTRLGL
jgi:hypothetical protein